MAISLFALPQVVSLMEYGAMVRVWLDDEKFAEGGLP